MLLGFFMNAAIDQQCERYIAEHKLEHLVESKFKDLYDDRGLERPPYQGKKLPKGNDGLGLTLLGLTGDQVLPPMYMQKSKPTPSLPFAVQYRRIF